MKEHSLAPSSSSSQIPATKAIPREQPDIGPERRILLRMTGRGTRAPASRRAAVTSLLVLAPLIVLLAGAGFAALESDTGVLILEGLWWSLSLMTTVGFVGEAPETTGGRVLSGVLMLSGFALLAVATAAIASLFVREEEEPEELRERQFEREALRRFDELAERLTAIEQALADKRRPGASASHVLRGPDDKP